MKYDFLGLLVIAVSIFFVAIIATILAYFISVYSAASIASSVAWLAGFGYGRFSQYNYKE